MRLANPYSLEVTLEKMRYYLSETHGTDSLELLEKAVKKADSDQQYAQQLEDALLRGSTVECREMLSPFGDYWAKTSNEFPYYPHHDAVNGIDTAFRNLGIWC